MLALGQSRFILSALTYQVIQVHSDILVPTIEIMVVENDVLRQVWPEQDSKKRRQAKDTQQH